MNIARIKEDKRAASESAALAEEGMPEAAMNNSRVADSTRRSTVNAEVAGVSLQIDKEHSRSIILQLK